MWDTFSLYSQCSATMQIKHKIHFMDYDIKIVGSGCKSKNQEKRNSTNFVLYKIIKMNLIFSKFQLLEEYPIFRGSFSIRYYKSLVI